MSFSSDRASLAALVKLIVKAGYTVTVTSDGDVLGRDLTSAASVHAAASATADPVRLWLGRDDRPHGSFIVLLQDDPDCLVVDHTGNEVCHAIFEAWSALADSAVVGYSWGAV